MSRLRGLGFTEVMLRDDAPSYTVLHRVPADQWAIVFDDWERLGAWRHADPWWQVGIRPVACELPANIGRLQTRSVCGWRLSPVYRRVPMG